MLPNDEIDSVSDGGHGDSSSSNQTVGGRGMARAEGESENLAPANGDAAPEEQAPLPRWWWWCDWWGGDTLPPFLV